MGSCFWVNRSDERIKHRAVRGAARRYRNGAPLPKNRADWWVKKLAQNKIRDRVVTRTLQSQGWRVIRVWECSLTRKNLPRTTKRLKRKISQLANLGG